MKYIIGIDSGGTSTKAAAYDVDGNLLKESKSGFGNLLTDVEQGLANIRYAIEELFSELEELNCKLIVLGAAGVDSGNFEEIIRSDLSRYSPEVIILNDAWMAHHALLQGEDGCLIISGTGSICIGRHKEEISRVGGWGNLLGDEGSGYDIAQKLIKKVLDAYDQGREYTSLDRKVLDYDAFQTPFELVKFVYSSGKDQIAELAMVVTSEAENGNEEAIEILEDAGRALASQTQLLIEKLQMKTRPNVAVTGSVLVKNDWVYESFKNKLQSVYSNCAFIRKDISNTIGGYYYYKHHFVGEGKDYGRTNF